MKTKYLSFFIISILSLISLKLLLDLKKINDNFENLSHRLYNELSDNNKKLSELIRISGNLKNVLQETTSEKDSSPKKDESLSFNIFDLKKPLQPDEEYSKIACRKSININEVNTTLCVHDLEKDKLVSGSIWRNGFWERAIITLFMNYVLKYPQSLVFDLGANIGQYTLFAAKAGCKVITVEPFIENILRIHKACKLENTQDRITLFQNALSDTRNQIKMLNPVESNKGAQGIIQMKERKFTREDLKNHPKAKFLVETILWDDLVPFFPLNENNEKYETAIIKLDIEASEPYAFQHAVKFFDSIHVIVIFMEWGVLPRYTDTHPLIENLLDFLYSRDFLPHTIKDDMILEREKWKDSWTWDVIWKKKGYYV